MNVNKQLRQLEKPRPRASASHLELGRPLTWNRQDNGAPGECWPYGGVGTLLSGVFLGGRPQF